MGVEMALYVFPERLDYRPSADALGHFVEALQRDHWVGSEGTVAKTRGRTRPLARDLAALEGMDARIAWEMSDARFVFVPAIEADGETQPSWCRWRPSRASGDRLRRSASHPRSSASPWCSMRASVSPVSRRWSRNRSS